MKKIAILLLSMCMLLCLGIGLTACGDKDSDIDGKDPGIDGKNPEPEHVCDFGEWEVMREGDCYTRGEKARYCTCGERETMETDFRHSYETVEELAATCYSTGYNEHQRCTVCGDITGFTGYPMVEHDFGEWEETSVQSCTSWGVKERYCQNEGCSEYERDEVEPLDHDWNDVVTERTETTSGYTMHYCQRSGCMESYKDNEIGPLLYFSEYKTGEIEVGASYLGDVSWVTEITVPDTYNDMPITKLGGFSRFTNLESVEIDYNYDNGIKEFTYGQDAFKDCTKLEYITVMSGAIVESGAFYGCSSLNVSNLARVKSVGYEAFKGCTSLEAFDVESGDARIEHVEYSAFSGCTSMKRLYLPKGSLDSKMNKYNQLEGRTLASYFGTVPASLTTLNLTHIREIGDYAFENCTSLTDIRINAWEGVLISNTAFNGCTGLSYREYNNGRYVDLNDEWVLLEVLDKTVDAFELVSSKPVVITSNVFEGCTNLTTLTIDSDQPFSVGAYAFANCMKLRDVYFGQARAIGEHAFENCKSIYTADFGALREIKEDAFLGCTNLVSVWNNSTVEIKLGEESHGRVAYYAFDVISGEKQHTVDTTEGFVTYTKNEVCYLLGYVGNEKEITVPEIVDVIKAYSIHNGVERLTILETVTTVEGFALNDADSLVELIVPFVGETMAQTTDESETKNTSLWWIFGQMDKTYSYYDVPASLKYVEVTGNAIIPNKAFTVSNTSDYPVYVEKIVISGQPEKMGGYLFNYWKPNDFVIPYLNDNIYGTMFNAPIDYYTKQFDSLEIKGGDFGEYAFDIACVETLIIGEEKTTLGDDAFKVVKITSLIVKKGVDSINKDAFSGADISTIYYEGTQEEWDALYDGYLDEIDIVFNYNTDTTV